MKLDYKINQEIFTLFNNEIIKAVVFNIYVSSSFTIYTLVSGTTTFKKSERDIYSTAEDLIEGFYPLPK